MVKSSILHRLEGLTDNRSDIVYPFQFHQEPFQLLKLRISFPLNIRQYRHPILRLETVRQAGVINQNHIPDCPRYHPQILNIKPFLRFLTMLSIQPMVYKFPLWIKVVQNSISIVRVTSSEYNDLKVFGEIL